MIPDVLRSNKNMGKLQTEGELARASENTHISTNPLTEPEPARKCQA